jgi:hypothetical protein
MNTSLNPDSHDRKNEIEAPVPTIMGPRPEAVPGATIAVPRGLENLLTLAAMNEDWKDKTLADPIRAAAEAEIQHSPSESAILRTIPANALGQMILSFVRARLAPIRDTALAVGTASASLLATTDVWSSEPATDGIRPDIPQERTKPTVPAPAQIKWEPSLAAALKQAAATNRAVMVVCPYGAMLEKCDVADDAPLVFFLAPDGTVLSREQMVDERKAVSAVAAVPVLLAKWLTAQKPPADPAPPATKRHTKDWFPTHGAR